MFTFCFVGTLFTSENTVESSEGTSSQNPRKIIALDSAKMNLSTQPLISQRKTEHEEIETDLNIPKSMQDFVYKKMSKKIADSIEFVEFDAKKSKTTKKSIDKPACVRLLNDTDPIVRIDFELESDHSPIKQKIVKIKRRIIEPDAYDDADKLKMASIDSDYILRSTETKHWKLKKIKPNKMFNYREKKSILYLVDTENEFSTLRKKNNWSESKIAKFPWKNHMKQ